MAQKIPLVIADFETQISGAIAAGDTSFTLASATDDDGNALAAGKYCFTVNNGRSNKQYLLGQLNGTSVTSVVSVDRRGNETSGAALSARSGSPVIISDFATIQRVADILRGQETLDGDNPIVYDAEPTLTNREEVATVGYVLDNVTGGTVNFDNQIISSADATAGETIAAGDWVFFQTSDQEWYKADADTVAEVDNVEIGVALGSGTDGASITGGIQKTGVYTTTGLTAGDTYYIGNTAGAITNSAGTTKRTVGVALSSTKLLMNPLSAVSLTSREKDALAGGGDLGTPSSSNKYMTQTGFEPALNDLFDAQAFATIEATATNSASNSAAVSQTAPSGTVSGDIVLVFLRSLTTVSVAPSGYTEIAASSSDYMSVYAKIATGADVFSCTLSNSAGGWVTVAYRISNYWGSPNITDIVKGTSIEISSTNPPALTPDNSYGYYTWFAAAGTAGDGNTYTAAPTNYTNMTTLNSGDNDIGEQTIAVAYRNLRAISEDPDAFTLSGSLSNAGIATVSVRGPESNYHT